MTEQEMLEAEKYWCENCCNWDKEEVQMDASATCKLTGTRVYAQESGKECKCFNVPAENVIVLPCKVGDEVYFVIDNKVSFSLVEKISLELKAGFNTEIIFNYISLVSFLEPIPIDCIGKTFFLTKEGAEKALRKEDESNG